MRAGTRASQFAAQLRDRFARQPKSQAFVGPQVYYRAFLEDSPARALVDHRGPYVGDEARQTEIIDAMAAGKKVVLVSAPPGCGKSRFALELARRITRTQRSWDVRFVRHDEAAVRQELPEIVVLRNVVLIVDDANDCPGLVEMLASACASAGSESSIHLICLTRPSGRSAVTEALASHFAVGEPLEVDLGRPDAKLVRELIGKLIPNLSPHHRDAIRRIVGDSFFAATLLCSSVARQKNLPQTLSSKNLRDFAVRQPVAQAIKDLCPPEKAFRALAVYAVCTPVPLGDEQIRQSAATHSGLSAAHIETLEQRVLEAGLFQADDGRMRPVPHLVGDLILEETCLNDQGRPAPFGQQLLRALFLTHPDSIATNCADIGRLFASTAPTDFLSELVLERAEGLSAQTRPEALDLLKACSSLTGRQPATVVRVIDELIAKGVLQEDPEAQDVDELELRAQLLLRSASDHDPTIVPRTMEHSRRLLQHAAAPRVSQALRASLASSCQFAVSRPIAHAAAVLDILDKWAESADAATVALAAYLVSGYLQLEMSTHRWEQGTMTVVLVSLSPNEEIAKLRDRAVAILVRCARHSSPEVQHAATDSLKHWAHGYSNLAADLRERWAPQLNKEMDSLAESFSKLGSSTTHFVARAAIERQGWRWCKDAFTTRGGKKILAGTNEALSEANPYSLWKALHDETLPVFAVALDEPGKAKESPAKQLFDKLDPACTTTAAWTALFTSVLSALPRQPLQKHVQSYLAEFVKRHPTDAWAFVTEAAANGPLGVLLPGLLAELRSSDKTRWQEAIQQSAPGTRLFEVELAALYGGGELDAAERSMVSKGLQLDDPAAVHLAAQALLGAKTDTLAEGLQAVLPILRRNPTDERLWELVLDAFARWGSPVLSLPEGDEADPQTRALSGELLMLLRTYGNTVLWDEGPHTQRLTTVAAIFAVAIPHTLKSWMRELWSPPPDPVVDCGLALSTLRWMEAVRLVAPTYTAPFWQKQFAEWMAHEPDLAEIGERALAEILAASAPVAAPEPEVEVEVEAEQSPPTQPER